MSHVYLKPYQIMMADWLAEYKLSANEDKSSEEDRYVGNTFTTDDFGIQSDLIGRKQIYSMQNKKFAKVHPDADHKLVSEFDPAADKADKWIFDQVVDKPKHRSAKLKEKPPSPDANETNPLPKMKERHQPPKTDSAFSLNKSASLLAEKGHDTGDERLL